MFTFLINPELGIFILSLVVGGIFIFHGWPKMPKAKMMAKGLGMPASFVWTLGLVETLSGAALIVGWQVQIASLLLALVMVGAILFKKFKWHVPFAAFDKTGWEFDLVLLAASLAVFFVG